MTSRAGIRDAGRWHTPLVTEEEVLAVLRALPGTVVVTASEASGASEAAWGDSFAIYDPDGDLPPARQRPFTTVVVRDVPGWDTDSHLDREGVFRVNIDVGSRRYAELLGHRPVEHAGRLGTHDYAADDVLVPHPVYAAQGWVSVVRPGPGTGDLVRLLIAGAHAAAARRWQRRRTSAVES
jgi:Family of unknown function (DUF6194)